MNKTDKIYESPEVNTLDLMLEGAICQASTLENNTLTIQEWEDGAFSW